jgi:hypothetical protein
VIAAASKLLSAASTNANRTDGPTAPAASGTGSAAKAGSFWSLLGDYLGDDGSDAATAPERRPASEDKRDHHGQAAPIAVPVLEVKPEIPILDWGLPSRETADVNSGSGATASAVPVNSHGPSVESAPDAALPEEAATQNPQGEPGTADGVSDLAFAARMFQSEPQQDSQKTFSSGAPGVTPDTSTQASIGLQVNAEISAAVDGPPAVVAVKATLPGTEESRNQSAHDGQPEANNIPGDTLPAAADRESPAGSTAEARETGAARPAELVPPPAPPVSHDVSLRLADGQNNVDIRMSERAGEIRVMVHTPDGNLANSMRSELPDLVGKLRQAGYQAETWRPAAPPQTDGERRSGADSSPQQHWAGGRRDGRQQQQQQQQQNQPRWVGEWNMSFDPGQESSI